LDHLKTPFVSIHGVAVDGARDGDADGEECDGGFSSLEVLGFDVGVFLLG
jgi:hypothetical protein